MEGKEKEAVGMEKEGETRPAEENEKEVKKKRGRLKKEAKEESKAVFLKKFLNKKKAGTKYTVSRRTKRTIQR